MYFFGAEKLKLYFMILVNYILNKDFDIENLFLFYPNETFYKQNVRDVLPLQILKLQKIILVKIRDNLQKTTDFLPE